MAAVKLNAAAFSKTISESVSARILVDFAAKDKRQFLSRDFDTALDEVAAKMIEKIRPTVEQTAKAHYKESFDGIAGMLNSGLAASPNDSPVPAFSRKYYQKKLRYSPATANLFWKFKGSLSKNFRVFAGNKKGAVTRTKAIVSLQSRGYKYRKRTYSYAINMLFPVIGQSTFLDSIFRQAYFNAADNITFSRALLNFGNYNGSITNDPLAALIANETYNGYDHEGNKRTTRPFVAKEMARRGKLLRGILEKQIKELF